MLPGQKNRCLFQFPHTGFRGMFYELASLAGSTDYLSDAEVKTLVDKFENTAAIYIHHNNHESGYIVTQLKTINAEEAAKWEAEHSEGPKEDEMIRSALKAISEIEDQDARRLAGAKIIRQITNAVAEHLKHMNYEETVIMDLFRSKLSDAELDAMEVTVIKNLPPAFVQMASPLMIKYHSTPGRAHLFRIIKATAPPPAFAGACGLAKSVLSSKEFEDLEKAVGFSLTA